jgi:hypothetical protein
MGRLALILVALSVYRPVWADQVSVTGAPLYVTRGDCAALVQHHPSPDVAYRPGTDVHGKYVPPADLPGSNLNTELPGKAQFHIVINPLTFSQANAGQVPSAAEQSKYGNTMMAVGRVDVDIKTGDATFNGRPLTGTQDQAVREACRKAGIR